MTVAGSGYLTEEAGEDATAPQRMLGVWAGNLGEPAAMEAKLAWFYGETPAGRPTVCFLVHAESGQTVGVASAGPRRVMVDGRPALAGVLVDLAVERAHRTLFPALALQKQLIATSAKRFAFAYGFPNPKAAGVFARVGYRRRADLLRYALVLRSRSYLARKIPAPLAALAGPVVDGLLALRRQWKAGSSLRVDWHDRAPAAADEVWQRCATPGLVIGCRDRAHLAWRFDAQPGRQYSYAVVHAAAVPVAVFVLERAEDGSFHVRDWLVAGHDAGLASRAWRSVASASRRAGARVLSVEYCGPADLVGALATLGFAERSRRNVYWLPFSGAEALEALPWYLTSGDEDE